MHFFSGFDMATCLELASFLELASSLEMCPASVAPVVARLEKMRSPNFIFQVSSRHSGKFAPFGADTPRTPQCGAVLAETLTAAVHLEPDETTKSAKDDQIG
ncbi:MAG: hypothetical protein WBW81_01230 [Methylocella sp.]